MNIELGSAYWRLKSFFRPGLSKTGDLPADVIRYLSKTNPRFVELKNRYAQNTLFPHSFWGSWEKRVNLLKFRGEDDYVSQAYFRQNKRRYELTYAYVEAGDDLGLLNRLCEDSLFGAKVWEFVSGKPVSRDLLDSVLEITFLQRALQFGLKDCFRILDIGAGYGRFADRFTTVFTASPVTCIDAIATSTFLSEFYLKFRKHDGARIVPFDCLNDLKNDTYDLAVNIHSWSECTKEFICFWLDRLCDLKIPYLFIVPHNPRLETVETNGEHLVYDDELERRNFKLIIKQRKFQKSEFVHLNGVFPTEYYLFKRKF
jgi:putative sugar O-methyltransferase